MVIGIGFKGGVLGLGEETTFGTAVARTKFIELTSDGLEVSEEALHSGAIPEIYMDDDEFSQGAVSVAGELGFEMRYEGAELLFKHAMGTVASVETASFVVDATNEKINFNIGAAELTVTVASGTYIAGATHLIASSLCKAVYDAIVAAEVVGTYTVSFDSATNLFTITRSAGTFVIMWKTGTNGADGTDTHIGTLLGYSDAADDTGALTYSSDTAVQAVWTHTFTLADALPTGLTLEVDRDTSAFISEGTKINTLGLSIEYGGFLMGTIGVVGEDMTNDTVTASTLPTAPLVNFSQGAVTYAGGSVSVKSANFSLNNNISTDRRFIGSRLIAEPQRTGKIEVTGSFNLEFDGVAQYTDFRAATSRALTMTFTGATDGIKTDFKNTITITFPVIKLTAAMPKISDAGVIQLELPFKAYASSGSAREFNVTMQNTVASV